MHSNRLATKICLNFGLMFMTACSHVYAQSEKEFSDTVNALFNETEVFQVESRRLIDNTNEVEKAFLNLNTVLRAEHRTAQTLVSLDRAMTTMEKSLQAAAAVPQIREQALQLRRNIEETHKPVAKAASTMAAIDAKVVPLLRVTERTQEKIHRLIKEENRFRKGSLKYFDALGLVSQCESRSVFKILDESRRIYKNIDLAMSKINDEYDDIKSIPEKSLNEIVVRLKKIEPLEAPVVGLHDELKPLLNVLEELESILDRKIGVTVGYPCGAKICEKDSPPFPCGTKKCKTPAGKVPCGVKTCTEKVPYPCGVKTCDVDIRMSVSDIIQGADAIERKIKSLLSSTAYAALKEIGLGPVVRDLEKQANSLLKPVLRKLNLNVNPKFPTTDIDFELRLFDVAIADIGNFELKLTELSDRISIRGPIFGGYTTKLNEIGGDIVSVLNTPVCNNAGTGRIFNEREMKFSGYPSFFSGR